MREALIRLNPEIAAQPDRADDVLYRLRAILMGVRTDGLVRANEEFAAWLAGERSMPFGADGEHVTVRLVDLEDVERDQYVVSAQYTVRSGANERRADLVLLLNGLPLVVIEVKTPVRSSRSWFDGATQIRDDYERNVPDLFVPNLCSVATEGKDLRYGSIGLLVALWGPWRADDDADTPALERIKRTVSSMLRPHTVLDLRRLGRAMPALQRGMLQPGFERRPEFRLVCGNEVSPKPPEAGTRRQAQIYRPRDAQRT